jgi:hypothetical protein
VEYTYEGVEEKWQHWIFIFQSPQF